MEREELQSVHKCLQKFPKLLLWIIEYVWAHKMTDIDLHQVVDPSDWPKVDSQPLSLEDSWRLRVSSAQTYSIVKNRDIEHFESAMGFLEDTYRLLPTLVAPLKHMKIMFGLKTMVVMWRFREGRGIVNTVFKINQFFPSKLPQYQQQCSQHEMFLMRKNQLDFKTLALALAVDKDKREDYIMNQLEEQYGEHYAQKVEDRLLHYLHKLETVLPGDTYIDKILKKGNPMDEEEKLLLEVIASDSQTIETTLKKMLHCDVAACHPGRDPQTSEHGRHGRESSQVKCVLHGSSSKADFKSVEVITTLEFQPVALKGEEEAEEDVSKDTHLLLENENDSDVGKHQQTEDESVVVERMGEESGHQEKEEITRGSTVGVQEATSSPQFCSKHQRWVKSILQECPDVRSEELLLQANVSSSPLLFQSSSSVTSSQDLTPSDLIPCPPDQQHPPSHTSTHLQTTGKPCKQAHPKDKLRSGSHTNSTLQEEPLLQPFKSRKDLNLLAVVQLVDIASVRGLNPPFKPHQESLNQFTGSVNSQAASTSSPHFQSSPHPHTSRNNSILQGMTRDCTFDRSHSVAPIYPLNITHQMQPAPGCQDASTSDSCQPSVQQSFCRLSRKYRWACTTNRQSQTLDGSGQKPVAEQLKMAPTTSLKNPLSLPTSLNVSGLPTLGASTSPCQPGIQQTLPFMESPQVDFPQTSVKYCSQTCIMSTIQSMTPAHATASFTSNSNFMADRCDTSRFQRAHLRLSLPCQAVLLQSKLLQPYVSLTRLSPQDCCHLTQGRSSNRFVEPVAQNSSNEKDKNRTEEGVKDANSSFDMNILYSSYSSISDGEDSFDSDPDYKPCISKKRLLLEYEAARTLIYK